MTSVLSRPQYPCLRCRHRATPGYAYPGYCAQRTDTPPAYGPDHPLHQLPADFGAGCDHFARFE